MHGNLAWNNPVLIQGQLAEERKNPEGKPGS